ncbi:putative transcription factor interactor and regulator CCHC(Zn) family [Helianthus annuus]|nr:putative transcription factor interactor and regulator CCHC(Zn) family [Helianthus annuus]
MSHRRNDIQMSVQTDKFAQQIGEVILKTVELVVAMSRHNNEATQEASKKAEAKPPKKSRKRKAPKKPVVVTPNQAKPSHVEAQPAKKPYLGTAPLCNQCNGHHPYQTPCSRCTHCGRWGHLVKTCRYAIRNKTVANPTVVQANPARARFPPGTCYNCGEMGHFRNKCPRVVRPMDEQWAD